jgi:hypothetical protein
MKKLNIYRYPIYLLSILILSSCDPASFAVITNESGETSTLEIQFNKEKIEESVKLYGSLEKHLKKHMNYHSSDGRIINVDTLKYIAYIKLNRKDTFMISGGLGGNPNFDDYRRITIISKDTLNLNSIKEMRNAFKKNGVNIYELKIE